MNSDHKPKTRLTIRPSLQGLCVILENVCIAVLLAVAAS